jgi:RNA polymerase sigma-70 factor, ECF subfamily
MASLRDVSTAAARFDARVEDAWIEHHARLWRALLVWSGSSEVASDAVAEAFAQVLRRGDEVADVSRWVWTSAFRIAGGLLSRRPDHVGLDALDLPSVDRSDAADVVALADAVATLADRDRTIAVLCLVGGWSPKEVGDLTGTSAGSVRVRLHRVRARLRELLEVEDG